MAEHLAYVRPPVIGRIAAAVVIAVALAVSVVAIITASLVQSRYEDVKVELSKQKTLNAMLARTLNEQGKLNDQFVSNQMTTMRAVRDLIALTKLRHADRSLAGVR